MTGETERTYVLEQQYKTDANLAARQAIYRFQTVRTTIYERVLALANLRGEETILDVGCGNGRYLAALDRAGHAGAVAGFDLAPGMLAAAMGVRGNASIGRADAERLPVASASIDVTLAMHMLYHVPDRARAIRELRRVTKGGGTALVVTNRADHMHELDKVIFDLVGTNLPGSSLKFTMESGESELRASFESVERHDFQGELAVTDAEAVVDYVGSVKQFIQGDIQRSVLDEVRAIVAAQIGRDGVFRITTAAGCFVCR